MAIICLLARAFHYHARRRNYAALNGPRYASMFFFEKKNQKTFAH